MVLNFNGLQNFKRKHGCGFDENCLLIETLEIFNLIKNRII